MKTGASRLIVGVLLGMGMLVAGSGCTICCAPFDYHYGAYGGAWERDDMVCGRVGSAFHPAGHPTKVRVLSKPLEPTPIDEPSAASPESSPSSPMSEEIPPSPPSTTEPGTLPPGGMSEANTPET